MSSNLAAYGIRLARPRVGWQGTACPHCARTKRRPHDDALGVELFADGGARWSCQRCGWKGTTAASYQPRRRRPFALRAPKLEPFNPASGLTASAAHLWRECRYVAPATVAAIYLERRGCALPHPEGDLRWHPALRHLSGHVGPGLVARVTDAVTIEPMTLHRTWIKPDGSGKAEVDPPRLLWKGLPKAGGVVRLSPDEEVTLALAVGEGIETSLALARGFGLAWACLDAGNLAALPVLAGIDSLTIAADHDPPDRRGIQRGIQAAQACAERWAAAGREVRLILPPVEGADFADLAAS